MNQRVGSQTAIHIISMRPHRQNDLRNGFNPLEIIEAVKISKIIGYVNGKFVQNQHKQEYTQIQNTRQIVFSVIFIDHMCISFSSLSSSRIFDILIP